MAKILTHKRGGPRREIMRTHLSQWGTDYENHGEHLLYLSLDLSATVNIWEDPSRSKRLLFFPRCGWANLREGSLDTSQEELMEERRRKITEQWRTSAECTLGSLYRVCCNSVGSWVYWQPDSFLCLKSYIFQFRFQESNTFFTLTVLCHFFEMLSMRKGQADKTQLRTNNNNVRRWNNINRGNSLLSGRW